MRANSEISHASILGDAQQWHMYDTDPSDLIQQLHIVVVQFPGLPRHGAAQQRAGARRHRHAGRALPRDQLRHWREGRAFEPVMALEWLVVRYWRQHAWQVEVEFSRCDNWTRERSMSLRSSNQTLTG